MGVNSGLKDKKSSAPGEGRQGSESKTSINHKSDEKPEVDPTQGKPKSSPEHQNKIPRRIPRLRPRTAIPQVSNNQAGPKLDRPKTKKSPTEKSNLSLPPKKKNELDCEHATTEFPMVKNDGGKVDENNAVPQNNGLIVGDSSGEGSNVNSSNTENSSSSDEHGVSASHVSPKSKDVIKKRIETPKTSSDANQSKKSPQDSQKTNQATRSKAMSNDPLKRKNINEKVKEALKEDFSALLPLYQTEIKKITDIWVNTIYGSLTMRSHLVKLLVDAFPNINTAQFQTEDDRLLKCIAQAKTYTETETENLIQFIKSLLKSQNSAKEENESIVEEREIANLYSNDWSLMTKKLGEIAEETRKLQMAIPEEEKKKGLYEKKMKEKIRETESTLAKKEEEINKLVNQLNILKQKEISFREGIAMKLEDFNEIKADIESLKTVEQEYHEVKSAYFGQSEMYKKKIDALQSLLEEKKKTLENERKKKKQLQAILGQLQAQQQKLRISIGSEQMDYIMGQTPVSREKSREQLWIAAVKLVLRAFLAQMKKLEYDKNRMLLELQSNDLTNFKSTAATIVRKDHFMKTIVSQMIDFHKSCNSLKMENCENALA